LIAAGRVAVNGRTVTEPGTKADPATDTIAVDGKLLHFSEPARYLMLNKPPGVLSTRSDPQDRATVMQLFPASLRKYLYPVGRLDMHTEGLLLLTNDGKLTHALTHPSFEIPRTYLAAVRGRMGRRDLQVLLDGVELEDGLARVDAAEIADTGPNTTVLRLTLHEGRKREIRRLCEAIGRPVLSLKRVSLGPLRLGRLQPGSYRELSQSEVERLYEAAGLRRGGDDGT